MKQDSTNSDSSIKATLELLNAVGTGDSHSQRSLSARLGVALGLTNAMLKRATRKGFVKIQQVPAKRFAYYLTSRGLQEKSRLVGEYLKSSLSFFRRARNEYEEAFIHCRKNGHTNVAFFGTGELAEIAFLAARTAGIEVVSVIDSERNESTFCGLPVAQSIEDAGNVDVYVVTNSINPQKTFETISAIVDPDRIITPDVLHIYREDRRNGKAGGK